MIKPIFLTIALGCFLYSCGDGNNSKTNSKATKVVVDKYSENGIHSIIDKIGYLKLNLNKGETIGEISALTFADNKFFICDSKGLSLYIFDINGNQTGKISRNGRGPNEYTKIINYNIDAINKRVVINDFKKFIVFDYDGNPLSEIKHDFDFIVVAPVGNIFVGINEGNKNSSDNLRGYNLFFMDNNGVIIKSELEDKTEEYIGIIPKCITMDDGSLRYRPVLSNTIYKITEDGTTPEYLFEYDVNGWKNLSDSQIKDFSFNMGLGPNSPHLQLENQNYIIPSTYILENDKYLFSTLGFMPNKQCFIYYNKNTGKSLFYNSSYGRIGSDLSPEEYVEILLRNHPLSIDDKDRFYIAPNGIMLSFIIPFLPEGELKDACNNLISDDFTGLIYYTIKD